MKKRRRRNEIEILKHKGIKIRVLPTGTRSLVVRPSARQAEDLCSNPSECHFVLFFPLRSFFSAILAKRWNVQFRQGLAQLNNVDSKTTSNNDIAIPCAYIYTHYYVLNLFTPPDIAFPFPMNNYYHDSYY